MAFIKINKENFFHNLTQFVKKTGSKDHIAIVLKDNAYGHGLTLIAKLSAEFGLTQAVVRSTSEANLIKPYFKHILVLGDHAIKDEQCSFTLNSLDDIHVAQEGSMVELKVDTGMHRNGISPNELELALSLIKEKKLILKGFMSHNRSADVLSSELFWQNKCFENIKKSLKTSTFKNLRFHSFNSASALRLACQDEALIRLGIAAYGYNELPDIYEKLPLKPVLSLWAKKVSSRIIKKGNRIGYGGSYCATETMTVSTYDLGYGDGWMRSTSTKPFRSKENFAILGRVSMDYISVEGSTEQLCIFDDAQQAGRQLETISYEVLTQLHPSLARLVV